MSERLQAVHRWFSTYERLVNSQNFFSSYLTQEDMSRLGRDYIGTGEYIERIFPTMGIRYIAVADGIDTEKNDGAYECIPFRAVLNDLYARDISKKVRVSLTARRKAGLFIGSTAPYGYQKSTRIKGKLVPNPECADTVRHIYQAFLSGKSMRKIARELTEAGVPSPSRQKNPVKRNEWNSVMIARILQNPTYCGNLTQGFVRTVSYKVKKRKTSPLHARITVCNTHEPLVTGEEFSAVQALFLKKREKNVKKVQN